MVFSSIPFLYFFLPAVVVGYYLFLRKYRRLQNIFLCIASLAFYAWGDRHFFVIMFFCIAVNWLLALQIGGGGYGGTLLKKRVCLAGGLLLDLGVLFVFKYLTFVMGTVRDVTGLAIFVPAIELPIGISFFTFQELSYLIDVYRGKVRAQRNPINVALYISFFPQLIAGPIVRYETIADQIENRRESVEDFLEGWKRFVTGLGKKVLLADALALLADMQFEATAAQVSVTVISLWMGAIAYMLQIYFDFSGYSDMAIGLGRMFGFRFEENFIQPYQADSVQDFWRRWHISLSRWFRDYVYIPLGGNRENSQIRNLFVVWLLTGIWHGANWTFILWGLLYFLLLTIERYTPLKSTAVYRYAGRVYTLLCVLFLWVLFRSPSVALAGRYIAGMLGLCAEPVIDQTVLELWRDFGIYLVIGSLLCAKWPRVLFAKHRDTAVAKLLEPAAHIAVFLLSILAIANSAYSPFIYFNF